MRKFLTLSGLLFFMRVAYSQTNPQQIQLFVETFEIPDSVWVSDSSGPGGVPKGNNIWVINDDYTGDATYPPTTSEDSVYAHDGTITDAPHSHYLHIYDSEANPPDSDANFNPLSASDQFIYTGNGGFCTLGEDSVTLVFFYICQGDTVNIPPTAYGQVYYSADGGPWIQTGQPHYYKETDWKYEVITDTGFNNVASLRIGFRWVNADTNIAKTMSFGIDDIQLVGTYDSTVNPVDLSIIQLYTPTGVDTVCLTDDVDFLFEQSAPLCEGTYVVQLSDASGNFSNPLTVSAFDYDYVTDGSEGFWGLEIPANIPPGPCYEIRIVRTQPAPKIVGQASVCITVENCGNTITTLGAVVLTDPDTTCMLSAIDVQFYSTGVFKPDNVYTAQLGLQDSAGNFTVLDTLGSDPDPNTYDPSKGSPPGTVSGLIPVVPPGCAYYIRVVSSDPSVNGTTYGPFCLKDCDILTNNHTDIHVCISTTSGVDTTIVVKINEFNDSTHYINGNRYDVELLSELDLSIVNLGGLGAYYSTASNTFAIDFPDLSGLLALGIAPGTYYLRIVADSSSSSPYDTNGTIIRLTIGAPSSIPVTVTPTDTMACNGAGAGADGPIQGFSFTPDNPTSQYFWIATWFNNALPYQAPPGDSTLLLDFSNIAPNIYCIRVREENFGCYGPFSAPACINIITKPTGPVEGPPKACEGDTVKLSTAFLTSTYYSWTVPYGDVIDTSNNQITVRFDSAGTFGLSYYALNNCGSGGADYHIEVIAPVAAQVVPDTATICSGQSVQLSVVSPGDSNTLITSYISTGACEGIMFNVTAQQPLTIDSLDGNFNSGGYVPLAIYYRYGPYQPVETVSVDWNNGNGPILDTVYIPNGQDNPTPIPVNWGMLGPPVLGANDTVAIYVTTTNGQARLRYQTGTITPAPIASDNNMSIYEGSTETYSFTSPIPYNIWSGGIHYTTHAGINYQWSNGATTPVISVTPATTTSYTVNVIDTVNCVNPGTAKVSVNPSPIVHAGDSANICLGASVQVNATATDVYHWTPTTGIPDSNSLSFVLTPDSSITYYLVATNANCIGKDSLKITVVAPVAGHDTDSICTQKPIVLQLPALTGGGTYKWSTGDTTQSITVATAGTYSATYRANGDTCISTYVFSVFTTTCNGIQVPQAFAPSGKNRHFTVFGPQDIVQYDIKIFNRWGEMVYHSNAPSELNDLSQGWDGTYNGKEQNTGTFVYYIIAKDSYNDNFELHGNLELIR